MPYLTDILIHVERQRSPPIAGRDAANDSSDAGGINAGRLSEATPQDAIQKTPIALVQRGAARTVKLDLTAD